MLNLNLEAQKLTAFRTPVSGKSTYKANQPSSKVTVARTHEISWARLSPLIRISAAQAKIIRAKMRENNVMLKAKVIGITGLKSGI